MGRNSPALRIVPVLAFTLALTGCSPAMSPELSSVQPEVDAAVVASLPDKFASASTAREAGECLTVVVTLPNSYGRSAAMAEDTIDLLREGAAKLSCRAVLRIVNDNGTQQDVSHLATYLPVQARDGDLLIL